MDEFEVSYALNRHVPSMERGFTIATAYGELLIEDQDAAPFVALVDKLLRKRLAAARQAIDARSDAEAVRHFNARFGAGE